jgi:hypothetical protein
MCLSKLFKKKSQAVDPITPSPVLKIKFPEEVPDYSKTPNNTDINTVLREWFKQRDVPAIYQDYWLKAIDIQVYDIYPQSILAMGITQDTPALTWEDDGKRHMAIKTAWLNPGVISHEGAHTSYGLLNIWDKQNFSEAYRKAKTDDPLIKLVNEYRIYSLTSDIEGHAEIYRYLGDSMPGTLKKYYPKLF